MSLPEFAIVGHPNKGKSSIVSTLAEDESVHISPIPGTTITNRTYPMSVDDVILYELIDTPGFQRARAALEWMRNHAGTAMDRPETVRRFVQQHQQDPHFAAECQLLQPILDGAGILYVVDGSRPFGEEYEAEMEILRWTGQPSMALINMIGDSNYADDWEKALGQFFRIVRVFDVMEADFNRRLQLLVAFGELREDWRDPLDKAVRILRQEQHRRQQLATQLIAEMLAHMITHVIRRRLTVEEEGVEPVRERLLDRYKLDLADMEQHCRNEIEQVYNHKNLERQEPLVQLLDEDMFSSQTWVLFGLTRKQLIATGAIGGAAAGGVIDLAVHGASLLMGSGLGAVAGAVSAWLTSDRIADIKVLGHPLGGKQLSIGPMPNINFPYVVLGRALLHHRIIEQRTHANRGPLTIDPQSVSWQLSGTGMRRRFEKLFSRLRKQENYNPDLVASLASLIEEQIINAGNSDADVVT